MPRNTRLNEEKVGEGFVADFMPVIGIDVHATNSSLSCHPVCTFKGAWRLRLEWVSVAWGTEEYYFLWFNGSVLELQESFHRGGTIKDITDQISSLNSNLSSYDSPTQLVVDKYMKEHGLEVEPEEEEFGYGRLMIDYKPPRKSSTKISNKGKEVFFRVCMCC